LKPDGVGNQSAYWGSPVGIRFGLEILKEIHREADACFDVCALHGATDSVGATGVSIKKYNRVFPYHEVFY
jgi:hypothetical protein